MKLEELGREISTKKRTVADLVRFISTRTDSNPNYSLLLGAGCSISSGIRSAFELSNIWRKELYESLKSQSSNNVSVEDQISYLKERHGSWYDPAREYSSLFEKRYDLQRQRRMFVESEVSGKIPSIGYAYLTALVDQNYFNTIFTTNFDDLLNEAFYLYSDRRPIVCAHDSSIHSITVTSKRPKVIKLHGDYLFDDLKSTVLETESLEQNIKAKFSEYAKEYGLIVIGYSGGDRSIMDTLSMLLKNDMLLKGGVYWCIRKGSEVPEELRKLIWRDGVYFVEIDGFDELFSEVYSTLNEGDVLPASVLAGHHKPKDIASRLLKNPKSFSDGCERLKSAREKLERLSKRTALANLIVNRDDDGRRTMSAGGLTDDDMLILTEIGNLTTSGKYQAAIDSVRQNLTAMVRPAMRIRMMRSLANALEMQGEKSQALRVADEIIDLQPKKGSHYLFKATFLSGLDEQIACVDQAIHVDPYLVSAKLRKIKYLKRSLKGLYGEQKKEVLEKIHAELDLSIKINPANSNDAWDELFDTVIVHERDQQEKDRRLNGLIDELRERNPFSVRAIVLEEKLLKKGESEKIKRYLDRLDEVKSRVDDNLVLGMELLRRKAMLKSGSIEAVKDLLDSDITSKEFLNDSDFCSGIAAMLRQQFAKDGIAIEILREYLANDFDGHILAELVSALLQTGATEEAEDVVSKNIHKLGAAWSSEVRQEVCEAKGDYDGAMKELDAREKAGTKVNSSHRVYLLLKQKRFDQALALSRTYLAPVNYSPESPELLVNFEIARKATGAAVDLRRADQVLKSDTSLETKAAVSALLGKKADLLAAVRDAMAEDRTFRYRAADWPVFDNYRSDPDFVSALAVR